jgi:hypothetical protein
MMRPKPDPYDFWAAYVMGTWMASMLLAMAACYWDPLEALSWGIGVTSTALLAVALAQTWHKARLRRTDNGGGKDE